jgi:inosose dehydratase
MKAFMAVRLGVSPIGWSNDDLPELGGDTPLETCLAEACAAGFAGIELGNKFPRDARVLRPVLERHELALISGWWSGRLLDRSINGEWAAIAPHCDLLATMGCTVLVYAETAGGIAGDRGRALSARPRLGDRDWQEFGARLTELADRTAQAGMRLAYHHHMGTVIEGAEDIDRLMAGTGDSVGLLLDTGHLVFAGADPVDITRRHGHRINHVHCKDVREGMLASPRAR